MVHQLAFENSLLQFLRVTNSISATIVVFVVFMEMINEGDVVNNAEDVICADEEENGEAVDESNLLNASAVSAYSTGDLSFLDPLCHISPYRCKWSERDDLVLQRAVNDCKGKNWKKVAQYLEGKSDIQCLHRWQKVLKPGLIKGSWAVDEDKKTLRISW